VKSPWDVSLSIIRFPALKLVISCFPHNSWGRQLWRSSQPRIRCDSLVITFDGHQMLIMVVKALLLGIFLVQLPLTPLPWCNLDYERDALKNGHEQCKFQASFQYTMTLCTRHVHDSCYNLALSWLSCSQLNKIVMLLPTEYTRKATRIRTAKPTPLVKFTWLTLTGNTSMFGIKSITS
jgi:hypothetical protein